jgi:hypothetical protein
VTATGGAPVPIGGNLVATAPVTLAGPVPGTPVVIGGTTGGRASAAFPQTEPVSVITVRHGLGFRPNVSLFSLDYSVEYADYGVQHMSENELRVSMDQPTPCVVLMS